MATEHRCPVVAHHASPAAIPVWWSVSWLRVTTPPMPSSPPNPYREPGRNRPARWPVHESGNRSDIISVTVCANSRKCIFDREDAVTVILDAWREADAWVIGRYVIMPDHLHFFCGPRNRDVPLEKWIKFWKSRASQRWPRREEHPIWQENEWATQLRQGESYAAKWEYVRCNPVRHDLVAKPEDWPWAGEIEILEWHES